MPQTWNIIEGDALAVLGTLPDAHFHCCVTSPPYWGLRDYGVAGQLGLEKTPEEYVRRMVAVFAEVRRVLRDDGTLWLNIGDSYCSHPGQRKTADKPGDKQATNTGSSSTGSRHAPGCKPKDLVGIPWMLAFALRADGWYLRSEIIWHKRAPMPESVADRPTKAHEQVFLLTKSPRYFYNRIAASEPATRGSAGSKFTTGKTGMAHRRPFGRGERSESGTRTRNLRSVWRLSPERFGGAHFATMPTELARRCLLAGTSGRGCCATCGAPVGRDNQSGCEHTSSATPCRVIDPFSGAGTTGVVARRMFLEYTGIELKREYAELSRRRIRDDAPLLNIA